MIEVFSLELALRILIFTIFRCLIFIKFATDTSREKKNSNLKKIIGIISFILVNCFSFSYLYSFSYWIPQAIFIFLCIAYLSIFCLNHFVENLVVSFAYYITFAFISYTTDLIFSSLENYISISSSMFDYISTAIVLVIAYFTLTNIVAKTLNYKDYTFNNNEFYILMLFCLTGFFGLMFYTSPILLIVAAICDIAILVISSNVRSFRQKEETEILLIERNKFLEQQDKLIKDKEEERYKVYQKSAELDQQVRRINHDLMHHFNFILDCKKIEEIKKYIQDLKGIVEQAGSFFDTGSSILDLILQEKCLIAEKEGIKFKVMGDFSDGLLLEPASVSLIFGNLLNNAVEGCSLIPSDEYRSIDITFYQEPPGGFTYIKIANTAITDGLVLTSDGRLETTKGNKALHGIGLDSVKQEVEKYDGKVKITIGKSLFTAEVIIPVPVR